MVSLVWLASSVVLIQTVRALASQVVLENSVARATNHDRHGAVASESKICSQIGIDLMNTGGNAADAVGRFKVIAKRDD